MTRSRPSQRTERVLFRGLCWGAVLAVVAALNAAGMGEAEQMQLGDGLYARGMYDLAVREYRTFLREFPESANLAAVHLRLGETFLRMNDRAAAVAEFSLVHTNFPQNALRHKGGQRCAEMLIEDGKTDDGLAMLKSILDDKPDSEIAAACLFSLGDVHAKAGRTADAQAAFQQIREKFAATSYYPYALLRLGEILGRDKDKLGQAIEVYGVVAAAPGSPRVGAEALFQMAETYFRMKVFDKSAEAYRKLLEKYPSDVRAGEAILQAAWAAHNSGLYAEALGRADKALAGNTKTPEGIDRAPEWLYLKGNCERQLLRPNSAVQTYTRLVDSFPGSPFDMAARYEMALTHYKAGEFEKAIEAARKIVLDAAIKKDVYWLLAESFAALKKADDALQYYRLIITEFPKSDVAPDAAYRVAYTLQARNEFKEAARFYSMVVENYPDSKMAPQALFASAFCRARENLHAEAVRDWAALIQKFPDDPLVEESLYQKAMGEARLRRDKDSTETLQELLRRFPQSKFAADAHYWHGLLLKEANKFEDAADELRAALKTNPRKDLARDAEFQLGLVLYQLKKFDEAATLFEPLVGSSIKSKFPPALLEWLSGYWLNQKKFKDAVAAANLMAEVSAEPEWRQAAWCLVGRAQMANGNVPDAVEAYTKSLAEKAGTRYAAEAALRLGEIRFAAGKFDEAATSFRLVATFATDDATAGFRMRSYAGLGRVAKAKGDLDAAARYFMSVTILDDDPEVVPECLFEAMSAFGKLKRDNDRDKAAAELRKRFPDSEYARRLAPGTEGGAK